MRSSLTRILKAIMLSTLFFQLAVIIALCTSLPLPMRQKRDANFWAVRTKMAKDYSGARGDPVDKYFHESIFHSHYDGRFASHVLPLAERRENLITLFQSYITTMNNIGAQTWIMHGSLLGWWWNRRILPWDSDIDVQMSEPSMRYLADYYNMTLHHYKFSDGRPGGKDYLLEINPHWKNDSITDFLNVIDARWIDIDTGLFIDITTLRPNRTADLMGEKGRMMCKDKHNYFEDDIFPLRESEFEGIPVKIPYSYSGLLEEEYGRGSLIHTDFEGHHFDHETMEWIPHYQWNQISQQRGLTQDPVVAAPPAIPPPHAGHPVGGIPAAAAPAMPPPPPVVPPSAAEVRVTAGHPPVP